MERENRRAGERRGGGGEREGRGIIVTIPRPAAIKSSHTLDSISGSEWYTYPLPIDDAVAALEGALLCVSVEFSFDNHFGRIARLWSDYRGIHTCVCVCVHECLCAREEAAREGWRDGARGVAPMVLYSTHLEGGAREGEDVLLVNLRDLACALAPLE